MADGKSDFVPLVFVKVKASGSGTLTTIVWTALPMPPPGRSGPRSLMTLVTQGDIFAVFTKCKMRLCKKRA